MQFNDQADTFRRDIQLADRSQLENYQLKRLNRLLSEVLPANKFYREHYGLDHLQVDSLEQWAQLPTTTKSDWQTDAADGIAKHHTFPPQSYRRYHRTSGTRGRPMVILDSQSDWDWWTSTWQYVLDGCNIGQSDRILMAFSFGPFIGFWSAHDACLKRECLVIPSGGLSTVARIDLIQTAAPTVLFGTPSYALHLAQEASRRGISLRDSSIQKVFVAGEPGGSIPSVRRQIETSYGAEVMDHAGATEIGPWGFGSRDGESVHVIESEFIAEYLPLENPSGEADTDSDLRELVLTSLGRTGAPVLRYRTRDIVRPLVSPDRYGTNFVALQGGIIGRADQMFVVRGVNIFPTSIESILRQFSSIGEFRIHVRKRGNLDDLHIEVEAEMDQVQRLEEALQIQLGLRIPVSVCERGKLPECQGGKASRIQWETT